MSSGIFAVANIGKYRLYVGETHQLKPRWAKMMAMFSQGKFPSKKIQQAWQESSKERRFTFHTAKQISEDTNLLGYRQFLKDTGAEA
ncbi:hypothetical protein D0962_09765 [Leptolyngbyaceae cyanobacterium CCMR0082]|uniref:GIY-YIG domain-containing protein n=2 Tax=Adonisia turfae TaxID=2950184 RepID=A0A6M0S3I6_9CYAN|nr:hypothetical protein [Adonisia turfae]MDV3351665.1 hypothetical protein [Leptothoe sp. LEGE 181152]NEZ55179.1 hypothetical protein [Adonisia turfae CCMR0081]NEZ63064.1 hypothetical protein [Adonisia turfae CCMR0082]